jgi:hypothetical protein
MLSFHKLFIMLILMSAIILSSCSKPVSVDDVQKCEHSSDCVLAYTAGCCKCPMSINKEYVDYWDKANKINLKTCEGVVCDACGPKAISTGCMNNSCKLLYSPVGISLP